MFVTRGPARGARPVDRATAVAVRPLVVPPSRANPECIDLWIMSVLARISGVDPSSMSAIGSELSTACSQSGRTGALRWPNGNVERDEAGWWYPGGKAAK